jgi:hypothetical protein
MNQAGRLRWMRWGLALWTVLMTAGLVQLASQAHALGVILASIKWTAARGLLGLAAVLGAALWALSWTSGGGRLLDWFDRGRQALRRQRVVCVILLAASLPALLFLLLGPLGGYLMAPFVRVAIFAGFAASGAALLDATGLWTSWGEALAASTLLYTVAYRATLYASDVSAYPLSIGWSEGSRLYYASLPFARSLYGQAVPLSTIDPSRYLLLSLPFLIPGLSIWVHRLWQVLLWLGLTATAAFALTRRLALQGGARRILLGAWAFLFLFQGPVYFHLLPAAIIVLLGFESRRFWRSLGIVVLASVWAGVSRVNWIPVPGLLAATLYLLEVGPGGSGLLRYLGRPAAWVLSGTAAALASYRTYALFSGNPAGAFAYSFHADLLWYRLLPNATYGLGILPGALMVTAPVALLVASRLRRRRGAMAPIQLLALGAILAALLVEGLVVSVKIGGGDDLHNLDAYLIHLLVVGGVIVVGLARRTREEARPTPSLALLAAALLVPVGFAIGTGQPFSSRDFAGAEQAVQALQEIVGQAAGQGQEVLFISERQLLVFGMVTGVPLVPEYEKVYLMEAAMARDREYLDRFHADLQRGRFGLIVSTPLNLYIQGRAHIMGEENDVWVPEVSASLLQSYQPVLILEDVGVWVLAPYQRGLP